MKRNWFLKGQNKGASLIAVIATIAFVSIIGIIITQITVTNIQMKEIEQLGKTNFYSAEKVMDDLTAGMNTVAATAMQKAYTEMLSKYRTVTAAGGNVQDTFSRLYLDNLIELFQAETDPGFNNAPMKKFDSADADAKLTYQVGWYSLNKIKDCFSDAYTDDQVNNLLKTTKVSGSADSVAYYRADYTAGTFVVQGVMITSTDDAGYTTTISTDVVMHTPDLNFEGSNMVKEFMRYSLIADRDINVSAGNILVNGNAYAGDQGIHADSTGNSATFLGNTIITRGDIVASSGTTLNVGSSGSTVWAENVKTVGSGSPSSLTLDGTCYISDDLEVNGKDSIVTLKGSYYGYNFQKNYGGVTPVKASEYSSAILINGRKAKLNLTGLTNLTLSGRTYITRDSANNDVPLGESLSVRSNQMAYHIPVSMLDLTDPTQPKFSDASVVSAYLGVSDILNYVPEAAPVIPYYYTSVSNTPSTAYFLNFNNNEQNANNFFAEAFQSNKASIGGYAKSYLDDSALILSSDVILTLKGDIMYRTAVAADVDEFAVTINGSDWNNSGIFYERAGYLGKTYKSLQMNLEEHNGAITESDIRFGDDNDKTMDKLMGNLIKIPDLKTYLSGMTDHTLSIINSNPTTGDVESVVILIDNEGGTYNVPTNYPGGIIIATGNVMVSNSSTNPFKGMIIAGGTISFASNAAVQSDEVLVSRLFADDLSGSTSKFAFLFNGYNTVSDSVIGEVSVERYLTYDNWTKTID